MKAALLPDRGAVKVAGDDARKFLNGLITSDIAKMTPARPGFAALLTPQGKIIVDFILAEAPGVAQVQQTLQAEMTRMRNSIIVMAGLVLAISFRDAVCHPKRDARDKRGHDGESLVQTN